VAVRITKLTSGGAARLLFWLGHNHLAFSLFSFPSIFPLFPYRTFPDPSPYPLNLARGGAVSFPSGFGRSPASKQFPVSFEVKIAPLLTVALNMVPSNVHVLNIQR